MAMLTPLSGDEARALGALYGLSVVGVEGLLAGSVNSNFRLALEGGGAAFLRIYEEQDVAGAARDVALIEAMAAGGVPTPCPFRRCDGQGTGGAPDAPGEALAMHAGKPVAVMPWVAGEVLCQARVTTEVTRKVGVALARVHVAGARGAEGVSESRFGLEALAQRLEGVRGAGAEALTPAVRADAEALTALVTSLASEAEALGGKAGVVIHGDLFRDNVLWQGGEIAGVLDFESASRGHAAFDLAVTALAWCFGDALDESLVQALGEGYASVRTLGEEERGRLLHEARVAAVRFAVTRLTDYELRPAGRQYRDYRRFLARLAAVERLGPEGLTRLLAPAGRAVHEAPEVAPLPGTHYLR
ncbi:homoserine kinase [Chondromyces crocatus]|nr:homoserine kinase [Chondromyces crocatus]